MDRQLRSLAPEGGAPPASCTLVERYFKSARQAAKYLFKARD
jgi:hypothetical protein